MQEGFLNWVYSDGFRRVIALWLRVVKVTFDTFSIGFLLRTLFAPWKRDITSHVNASLQTILQDFGFNIISRLIGAFIRLATIFVGLVITGLVFIAGGLITLVVLLLPFLLFPSFEYLKAENQPLKLQPLKDLLKRRQAAFILKHAGIDSSEIEHEVHGSVDDASLKQSAEHFAQILQSKGAKPEHLLLAYFEQVPALQKLLTTHDLVVEELAEIVAWQARLWSKIRTAPLLAEPSKLHATTHIGIDWAVGFTPRLNRFARKIVEKADTREYLAHQEAVDAVVNVLRRSGKHNVILVGDPGVGKSTIVRAVARQFGDTRQIFSLDVNSLISGLSLSDDFETRLVGALNDAVSAGNVILYLEDIEILLDQSKNTLNAVSILQPYLESPNLQLIATSTFTHYHNLIDADPILAKNFERVDVNEPSDQQVRIILEELTPVYEAKDKITITYQALREIVRVSDRFMSNKRFPEKALDILDEIAAITPVGSAVGTKEIDALISKKTQVKVGEPLKQEKELLLHLENVLHKRLINQEQAVKQVADALRRVRAGVIDEKKPIGSFLFLGPTGVGKTETAKALAQAYFGSEKVMIRFDMSEYQSPATSDQLIEKLSSGISKQPFSLLLLDEIEKAYPDILNLFLQVLDDARLTTAQGLTIDFRNTIIIATSNAGSEFIRESNASGRPASSSQLLDFVQKQGIFKPEFLNRFTAVVAYHPLTIDQLKQVVDIKLNQINATLAQKQINLVLDSPARTKLAQLGFDPTFGARALERTMREKIENLVAQKILKEEIKKGETFTITAELL